MADQWSIKSRRPGWRLRLGDTVLEEGTNWELACPKGHGLSLYTNFISYSTLVGCTQCQRPYQLTLPSN